MGEAKRKRDRAGLETRASNAAVASDVAEGLRCGGKSPSGRKCGWWIAGSAYDPLPHPQSRSMMCGGHGLDTGQGCYITDGDWEEMP